jgi:hypothetical protein
VLVNNTNLPFLDLKALWLHMRICTLMKTKFPAASATQKNAADVLLDMQNYSRCFLHKGNQLNALDSLFIHRKAPKYTTVQTEINCKSLRRIVGFIYFPTRSFSSQNSSLITISFSFFFQFNNIHHLDKARKTPTEMSMLMLHDY